ncbi:UNVERIFIED_CONTAM: hypothetical protein Slati_4529300 [Sesamum latifolium]|uniref:Aminotransferase-like plant mobile domain-containing protein n=1 Tax=Sesamum latifolium TaxID=2727402 RepID=A0AAW2SG67_9LAMI
MPNSFFQTVTSLPSGLHGGPLNPSMAKYPFTPAIGSGLKTCSDTMRTSFMPPRSTQLYMHLFSQVSLSLWDIRGLCGLPVCGGFYDEVVPSSKDLLGDETSPPLRSSRKRVHEPKLSRNPSGDVYASNLPRAKDHDEPFTILQIPEDIRDETYVAAFLSCRLCNFVSPHNKVGKIHASTFKVASRMAHGECFSLAIPVLASIYRGLRDMSTSTNLFESSAIFSIHYVYGWIGRYLQTHFPPKLEPIGA